MISLFDWPRLSVLEGHLIAASIRGSLILIIAAALCYALKRASAAVRHFVWSVALTSLMALPLLSLGLPAWQIAVLPAAADSSSITTDTTQVARTLPEAVTPPLIDVEPAILGNQPATAETTGRDMKTAPAARETSAAFFESIGWAGWAIAIWLAGTLFISGRLLIGTASIWWIARRATKITDAGSLKMASDISKQIGLTRQAPMFKTFRITMPVTCGLIKPRLLLPADADAWPNDRRQVVLLHELAHVKRWDCATQLLGQIVCSLYWFNPLVWLANRQLRVERERACDDQVIEVGTKASDYAAHLLDMARAYRSGRCSSLATLAIARRSQLEGRLLAILDPGLKRRGLNRLAAVAAGLVIVCGLLPLASVRLTAAANSKTAQTAETITAPKPEPASQRILGIPGSDSQVVQPEHRIEQPASSIEGESGSLSGEARSDNQDAEAPGSAPQKDKSAVTEALREALKDEDPSVRQNALFALTQVGDEQALKVLVEGLKDQSWQVRANAAFGLGLRGGSNHVEALIGALRDASWQVRQQAAWGLGLQGDARAIEPLTDALRDENPEVREKAAWALGLKGGSRSVEPLIAALKDSGTGVRGMAAWALGLKGDSRAGDALKDALKDPEKKVRQKAAWALGMLLMKLGGAPIGLPDPDVDGDTDKGFATGGVPGGVRGGVPGGVSGGVLGGPSGGIPGGVPGGIGTYRLTNPSRSGPWKAEGTGSGNGSGVGAGYGVSGGVGIGAGDDRKIVRPKSSSKSKPKQK